MNVFNESSILDDDFAEASIGAAYRSVPIRHTYLYDLPGPSQPVHVLPKSG